MLLFLFGAGIPLCRFKSLPIGRYACWVVDVPLLSNIDALLPFSWEAIGSDDEGVAAGMAVAIGEDTFVTT